MNQQTNGGIIIFFLVVIVVVAVVRSARKWRTLLWGIVGFIAGVALTMSLTLMFPEGDKSAIGEASFDVGCLAWTLASVQHSRRTRRTANESIAKDRAFQKSRMAK
jgi:hypothetical protein